MFTRIKGVIDSQIAAEQARTRASQSSTASRSNSRARPGSRNTAAARTDEKKDPSEFEADSDATTPSSETPARSGTPIQPESLTDDPLGALAQDSKDVGADSRPTEKTTPLRRSASTSSSLASNQDLPPEVRVKLRKLEKIEGKHTGKPYLAEASLACAGNLR